MGATEIEALDALVELGAQVKVSYDARRTRLHAKAWLFHRDTGYSTGIIGSSNLSHAALLDGCEWNVRLSMVDNHTILEKFITTFDQYWSDAAFEPYDRAKFAEAAEYRDPARDLLARAVQIRPFPHQSTALDQLANERAHGHVRNLVVAATGTGKTVVAALDYARLRKELGGDPSLLFIAHREEILQQSLAKYRAALGDGYFGELLVSTHKPRRGRHVFASIQALHSERRASLRPDAYDVIVVDEFHHAAAESYTDVLNHFKPKILLGLTATPERADGKSVLSWFDGRIAAELRLWDALDQGLVVPFQYFGIHDGTKLSTIAFNRGRYDVASLESLSPYALYRLSKLSVWWLRLGIQIERITPGHPEQNGRHERMHLTLKKEATKPAAANVLQQQARFDAFVERYNRERPHQALDMKVPADVYTRSARVYRGLEELSYPFHDQTVMVTNCGRICFHGRKINFSHVFAGQKVGVTQVSDRIWLVTFMDYDLGYFDDETCRLEPIDNPFGPKVLPMCPE